MKLQTIIGGLAAVLVAGSCLAGTNDGPLVRFESNDYGEARLEMKAVELERTNNISRVRIFPGHGRGPVLSQFSTRAAYEIARARHSEYFIDLNSTPEPNGTWLLIVGFTNNRQPALQDQFGPEYTDKDPLGQPRSYQSVTRLNVLFGPQAVVPGREGPAAGVAPAPAR